MTLVAVVATSDLIVLAADRRLTWPDGSLADDNANKIVQFADTGVFGYTGIARIGGVGTDDWLAERLAEGAPKGLTPMLKGLREAADATLRSGPAATPLAILGAIWARPEGLPPVRPIVLCISNFHTDWQTPGGVPPFAFATHSKILDIADGPLITTVGSAVERRTVDGCRRLVRRRMRSANARHLGAEIEAILVDAIRELGRRDRRVGRGILTARLPRPKDNGSGLLVVNGVPNDESPTFRFYPSDAANSWIYGPTLVSRGGTILAAFRAGTLPSATEPAPDTQPEL